jgi:hypothetical protein
MGKINYGRVVLGGIIAGLILNIGELVLNMLVLAKDWEAAMRALNMPPIGGSASLIFIVLCFVLGVMQVWLYAALRPRFGAGPKTAICTGLYVWALAYAWSSFSAMAMGVFPARLFWISLIWGLFEVPIAALAGCWFYREV